MASKSILARLRFHSRIFFPCAMKVKNLPCRPPWVRSFTSDARAGEGPKESPGDLPVWNRYIKFGTAFVAVMLGLQVAPLMGQNTIHQAIALMDSRDPFFQRSGAWRLRQAILNDALRDKAVEAGSLPRLLALVGDDHEASVRKEAALALASITSHGLAASKLVELGAVLLLQRHLSAGSSLEPETRQALGKALSQLQSVAPGNAK